MTVCLIKSSSRDKSTKILYQAASLIKSEGLFGIYSDEISNVIGEGPSVIEIVDYSYYYL